MNRIKTVISPVSPPETPSVAAVLVESGVPADAEVIYRGRNIVARLHCDSGADINIKAFRTPHIINRMAYGWWRGSKARRSYDNALQLRRMGIRTPEPYGYIEEFTAGRLLRRSFFLSEQLPADFTELRHVDRRDDMPALVEALAAFIAGVHRRGVWMKDLSPGNVMGRRTPAGDYEFALIDINRMAFDTGDLEPLVRSCGTLLDSEAALTLFAGFYARELGIDGARAEETIINRYRKINGIHEQI